MQQNASFYPAFWRQDAPGFSVGVRYQGKNILIHHQGMAELEYGTAINDDSKFHVASVSKHVVVYLAMLLVQAGKLDLDRPVVDYLPDCMSFPEITTRHLIHHVSGIRDQWELFRMAGYRSSDEVDMESALRILQKQTALNFEPGTAYNYCNTGYTLLAHVIESICGKTLPTLAQEKIFAPLGMTHSLFRASHTEIIPGRTYSYEQNREGNYQKAILNFSLYGPTSLFTTVADLLLWGQHLMDLAENNPELYQLMTTSFHLRSGEDTRYAGGLELDDFLGYPIFKHSGWDGGYRAYFLFIPALQAVAACLSNHANFKPAGCIRYYLRQMIPALQGQPDPYATDLESAQVNASGVLQAGFYEGEKGDLYKLRQAGKEWFITMPEMPELPLKAHPQGGYWVEDTDMRFFAGSVSEGASSLVIAFPYAISRARWVATQRVNHPEAYCGRYYAPELEVFHDIVLRDGQLYIGHPRLPEAQLYARQDQPQTFIIDPVPEALVGQIHFEREIDGQPTEGIRGYQFSSPRAQGVAFRKE